MRWGRDAPCRQPTAAVQIKGERPRPSDAFCPVNVLAAEIAVRRASPVDLVNECLGRIPQVMSNFASYTLLRPAPVRTC